MDGPIGAHGETRSERVDALARTHTDSDNLRRQTRFLDPQSLFQTYLTKGVHRHLDVAGLHAALIVGWRLLLDDDEITDTE